MNVLSFNSNYFSTLELMGRLVWRGFPILVANAVVYAALQKLAEKTEKDFEGFGRPLRLMRVHQVVLDVGFVGGGVFVLNCFFLSTGVSFALFCASLAACACQIIRRHKKKHQIALPPIIPPVNSQSDLSKAVEKSRLLIALSSCFSRLRFLDISLKSVFSDLQVMDYEVAERVSRLLKAASKQTDELELTKQIKELKKLEADFLKKGKALSDQMEEKKISLLKNLEALIEEIPEEEALKQEIENLNSKPKILQRESKNLTFSESEEEVEKNTESLKRQLEELSQIERLKVKCDKAIADKKYEAALKLLSDRLCLHAALNALAKKN